MSQYDFGNIDPNTTSGTELTDMIELFRDALGSGNAGTSRPSYAMAGTRWIDTTNASAWALKMYCGPTPNLDATLMTLDPTTGVITLPSHTHPIAQITGLDAALAAVLAGPSLTGAVKTPIVTVASAASITFDMSAGSTQEVVLDQDVAIATPSNLDPGQWFTAVLRQNDPGGWDASWSSAWLFVGGEAPVLDQAANSVNMLTGLVLSATEIAVVSQTGFS